MRETDADLIMLDGGGFDWTERLLVSSSPSWQTGYDEAPFKKNLWGEFDPPVRLLMVLFLLVLLALPPPSISELVEGFFRYRSNIRSSI